MKFRIGFFAVEEKPFHVRNPALQSIRISEAGSFHAAADAAFRRKAEQGEAELLLKQWFAAGNREAAAALVEKGALLFRLRDDLLRRHPESGNLQSSGGTVLHIILADRRSRLFEDVSAGGVYTFPSIDLEVVEGGTKNYGFQLICETSQSDDLGVTFEIIPDYRGALVSDGVDDYGLCRNFPIFTKEKGYTVFSIDENLKNHSQVNGYYISNSKTRLKGAFLLTETGNDEYSWGNAHRLNLNSQGTRFNWQNTIKRNGISIESGEEIMGEDVLYLFTTRFGGPKSNVALYALEIYGRDLTEGEIAKVKERMIAEYEEKTGNTYEEETA